MDTRGESINSLKTLDLDLPPSCIEFCPASPEYFVVGTYNLQKDESDTGDTAASEGEGAQQTKPLQSRDGSLVLFTLTGIDISHVQTVPRPSAILDLHFHPHEGRNGVMAVVSSTATLSFFQLIPPSERCPATLREIVTHRPIGEDSGVLLLSCAWHPELQDLLAITTSSHEVHILRVDKTWNAIKTTERPVITHTLEAWTVAFSSSLAPYPTTSGRDSDGSQMLTVFSGGDDSKLLSTTCAYHPSRLTGDNHEIIETPYPTITFRGHEAGVTAILPLTPKLADSSAIVITGSYDDRLRIYRVYPNEGGVMTRRPSVVAEGDLGGGVWRLKLVQLEESRAETGSDEKRGWTAVIIASCMHAGCRVVKIHGDYEGDCRISVLARFEEHKSMNYGSDFQPGHEQEHKHQNIRQGLRCISTSFYDRLLCLWEIDVTGYPSA